MHVDIVLLIMAVYGFISGFKGARGMKPSSPAT